MVELLSKYLVYKCEDKTTLDIDDIKEICILYIERIEWWTNLPDGLSALDVFFENLFLGDIRELKNSSRMWTITYINEDSEVEAY